MFMIKRTASTPSPDQNPCTQMLWQTQKKAAKKRKEKTDSRSWISGESYWSCLFLKKKWKKRLKSSYSALTTLDLDPKTKPREREEEEKRESAKTNKRHVFIEFSLQKDWERTNPIHAFTQLVDDKEIHPKSLPSASNPC